MKRHKYNHREESNHLLTFKRKTEPIKIDSSPLFPLVYQQPNNKCVRSHVFQTHISIE